MLAAAGIVSGLFGMQLTDSGIGFWRSVFLVAALVAFVGLVVVVTVGIHWPKPYDEGEQGLGAGAVVLHLRRDRHQQLDVGRGAALPGEEYRQLVKDEP